MISIEAFFIYCDTITLMFILSLIFPLAVTLVIETGIYMILKHRDLKLFLVVSMMNLVLNPTMNIVLYLFGTTHIKYYIILATSEILTTIIESLIVFLFMKFKYLKILSFAFIANLSSFLFGLATQFLYENKTLLIIFIILFLLGYMAMYLVILIPFIRKNREMES